MSFLIFAWIATVAWGFFALVSKLTVKHTVSNLWLFNFLWNFFLFIFVVPIALLNHVGFPKEWVFLTLASICGTIWLVIYSFSVYHHDVTVLSPLYTFRTIFTLILSAVFLKESLTQVQAILFVVIFIMGIFSSVDERLHMKSFFNKRVGLTMLGFVFLSLSSILTKKALAQNGFWENTLYMDFLVVVFLSFTFPLFLKDAPKLSLKQISPILAMSIFAVIGNLTLNAAYKTNVGITTIILNIPISMILAFILSFISPKLLEKHTLKVYVIRFSAAIIMTIAGIFLSG